jgi:uncharacterized membrane protein (UPF0127 family)
MSILNTSRRTVLAEEVEIAESGMGKAKGLMFRKELPEGRALVMIFGKEGKQGVWMPFMRFPIDVIFLDSGKRVVGVHENVKPMGFHPRTWKVYYPEKPARYVIETNSGEVRKSMTENGHVMKF